MCFPTIPLFYTPPFEWDYILPYPRIHCSVLQTNSNGVLIQNELTYTVCDIGRGPTKEEERREEGWYIRVSEGG